MWQISHAIFILSQSYNVLCEIAIDGMCKWVLVEQGEQEDAHAREKSAEILGYKFAIQESYTKKKVQLAWYMERNYEAFFNTSKYNTHLLREGFKW